MLRCVLLVGCAPALCTAHGAMNKPPSWLDQDGSHVWSAGVNNAGCTGRAPPAPPAEGCAMEWYTNYTFIPGEPTIPPGSPLLTYKDACQGGVGVQACCSAYCQNPANQAKGQPCEGCDWTRTFPWRAPGTAPVFSPCGHDGGNPEGCPRGNTGVENCGGGGYTNGPDMRTLQGNAQPEEWAAGGTAEVSWGVSANHGGGYQYRLCRKPTSNMDLTEECFQQTPLRFVGNTQWLQRGKPGDADYLRAEIPAVRTSTGTFPAGSQWTRNPVPACGTTAGGAPLGGPCPLPPQFPPPVFGAYGFGLLPWNIVDKVQVPNTPGDYVVSWRYDCEQTSQVWSMCGDVRIVASLATPPPPAPTPSGGDQCSNPGCQSCCTGSCMGCRECIGMPRTGFCASCYAPAAGAPPCNGRGTQCLSDDGLACEACWRSTPLPSSPAPVAATSADYCDPSPACASCCTGDCSACRGYCEENPGVPDCAGCYNYNQLTTTAPPCNLRALACLHPDKLACEVCWTRPSPGPAPSSPTDSPIEPTAQPADPTAEPADPTAEPADPTAEPVEPTAEPVEPTAEPVEPTAEPVEPTAEPVEPTAEPVEPTAEPVEPTAEPVEPTAEPVEPTAEPVEPTAEPVEPTAEPADPTAHPTAEPGALPTAEPADPTAEPTERTAAPTDRRACVNSGDCSCEGAAGWNSEWRAPWCYRGTCYSGIDDSACAGQANGFRLGDGTWCFNGRRDTRCFVADAPPPAGTACGSGVCSCEGAAGWSSCWRAPWCHEGKCYSGVQDSICDGKPNGFRLGDGTWCFNERRDTLCSLLSGDSSDSRAATRLAATRSRKETSDDSGRFAPFAAAIAGVTACLSALAAAVVLARRQRRLRTENREPDTPLNRCDALDNTVGCSPGSYHSPTNEAAQQKRKSSMDV